MCLPIFFPVFMFVFIIFSLPLIFTFVAAPCWPLAFVIFSPPLWNFHFFFQQVSSPLFSIAPSSPFSVILVSANKKISSEKTRLYCFFLSNSPAAMHFLPNKNFELHLGCHTCWLSYLYWCTCGADGRSGGGGWTHSHVTNKISRTHRSPNLLAHGAPLRELRYQCELAYSRKSFDVLFPY